MRLPREIGYLDSSARRRELGTGGVVAYLRCTVGRWNIDLDSEEGREAFRLLPRIPLPHTRVNSASPRPDSARAADG
jgi:hypothetical protein